MPVNVTYAVNFSYTSPAAGNQVVLQGPGSLTVTFANGTTGGHVGAGPLHVASGTAMLANNFTVIALGQPLVFTGTQKITFPGSGAGTVTGGGAFNLGTVGHIGSGFVHCQGAFCFLAGFNSSVNVPLTSGPRSFMVNGALLGFPSVGPQSFAAAGTGGMTRPTTMAGIFGVTVTGQEVGRVVVPEPGTGLLLGCGLTGFGIALNYWRRRRA